MAQKTNNMAFKMKKGSPMERNFGISPMQKGSTSFIDRVKAAAKAIKANIGSVHGGAYKTMSDYRGFKRQARDKARDKATENK